MTELTLYSRRGCHLCDDMLESLEQMLGGTGADFEVVDVDTNESLRDRYGLKVPVLAAGDEELCYGHLDIAKIENFLKNLAKQSPNNPS